MIVHQQVHESDSSAPCRGLNCQENPTRANTDSSKGLKNCLSADSALSCTVLPSTGGISVAVAPSPGADFKWKCPPSARMRSRMLKSPNSTLRTDGGLNIPLKIEADAFVAHLDAQGA